MFIFQRCEIFITLTISSLEKYQHFTTVPTVLIYGEGWAASAPLYDGSLLTIRCDDSGFYPSLFTQTSTGWMLHYLGVSDIMLYKLR